MSLTIRPLELADVAQVVQDWNRVLSHDPVTEDRFRDVMLGDPNHDPQGTLVALDGTHIVGFMDSICRNTLEGNDGRGRPREAHYGYMRGLYAVPGRAPEPILSPLLEQVERHLRSKGKSILRLVQYTGRYLFPGLDTRYTGILDFLATHGFEQVSLIDDMDADLRQFKPNAHQRDAIRRAREYGATVVHYEPHMLGALRVFSTKVDMPHWFGEGWEQEYQDMVVAFRENELIGWANYSLESDFGSFGPTAVLPEHRSHGIGTWVLVETMKCVQEHGHDRIWAHWTNTPFYEPNGWRICRQYAFLTKELN